MASQVPIRGERETARAGRISETSLVDAREKRDEARKLLHGGIDPGVQRKLEKAAQVSAAANTMESVAHEWFEKFSAGWLPPTAEP